MKNRAKIRKIKGIMVVFGRIFLVRKQEAEYHPFRCRLLLISATDRNISARFQKEVRKGLSCQCHDILCLFHLGLPHGIMDVIVFLNQI